MGEGDGGAATTYWTRSVDANQVQVLLLLDMGHSAPLTDLLGVPARTGSFRIASFAWAAPGQDPLRLETPLRPVQPLVR